MKDPGLLCYSNTMATKETLAIRAVVLWRRFRTGGRPNEQERSVLREAYWASCLPKDPDYNVYQWVEDGFPELP